MTEIKLVKWLHSQPHLHLYMWVSLHFYEYWESKQEVIKLVSLVNKWQKVYQNQVDPILLTEALNICIYFLLAKKQTHWSICLEGQAGPGLLSLNMHQFFITQNIWEFSAPAVRGKGPFLSLHHSWDWFHAIPFTCCIIVLDKRGYHVNIFLIFPQKHMLWVFIRSASGLISTNSICFQEEIRKLPIHFGRKKGLILYAVF